MAGDGPIQCSVITPESQVLDTTATSVVIPAHDGQTGILKDRAPMLCELGTGILRVETAGEGTRQFYVDGGFAQVLANEIIVLTERAAAAEDIDRADAEKALAEAEQMPIKGTEAVEARNRALRRAKAQLGLARSSS